MFTKIDSGFKSNKRTRCRISIKNDRFQAENGHFSFVLEIFSKRCDLCFMPRKTQKI